MTTCIIGSSHVGGIARAYNAMQPETASTWSFFAVPNGFAGGAGLDTVVLDPTGSKLIGFPALPGKRPRTLDIAAFDAFVLVGGQPNTLVYAHLLERTASAAFREAAFADMLRNNNNFRIFQHIRSLSKAPVGVATCLYVTRGKIAAPRREAIEEAEARLDAFWRKHGAVFLPQPRETLDDTLVTRLDCKLGEDNHHLTDSAARFVVDQILREVS